MKALCIWLRMVEWLLKIKRYSGVLMLEIEFGIVSSRQRVQEKGKFEGIYYNS
jgi:hypothetical protein